MSPSPQPTPLRGAGAIPDFDHPLEMLAACHDRIEDRCELLHRLAAHLAAQGCDQQASQAAASILRYFDTAGAHHHEDEERDLFPALIAKDAGASSALVAALLADHAAMREAWLQLRVSLLRIADGAGTLEPTEAARFTTLYRAHIAREEAELLPLAQRVLDGDTIEALGAAMARRRGVAQGTDS